MILLDGKKLRDKILNELKEKIENNHWQIRLAIIYVGINDASEIYIKNKINSCNKVGIDAIIYKLDSNTNEDELINLINKLNSDDSINGIILQSPIPVQLDFNKCSNMINKDKDVDGFTMENVYANYLNLNGVLPCTVKGIIRLLDEYKIDIEGKNVVIVGRGNIVGKPLALALENRNASVTVLHTKSKNIKDICSRADI